MQQYDLLSVIFDRIFIRQFDLLKHTKKEEDILQYPLLEMFYIAQKKLNHFFELLSVIFSF